MIEVVKNDVEVAAEKEAEVNQLKHRTGQLYQLIAFDPKNNIIYRNEIVEINIRLVPLVLKKYRPYSDDDFQLGCLGLIRAANTFDSEKGVPFHNYACFCIERELHKAHKKRQTTFEYALGYDLQSLDEMVASDDGEGTPLHEQIEDIDAQEEFEKLLSDFCLGNFFDKVVYPVLEEIADNTKGQQTKLDGDKWRELEMRYLLEMAQIKSQKARFTLSGMAKELGMSTQNIRMRHLRVVNAIRKRCIELGYHG